MDKTSAYLKEIILGLDSEVKSKASTYKSDLQGDGLTIGLENDSWKREKKKRKIYESIINKHKKILNKKRYKSRQTGKEISFSKALKSKHPKAQADMNEAIESVVKAFEKKVINRNYFKVGEYTVKVVARGDKKNPDLYLACNCKYWRYQGPEYHAVQNDYLFGKVRGTAEQPTKRDPNGTHKVCKHVYAVLRDFFGAN